MASTNPLSKGDEIRLRNNIRIILKACLKAGLFRTDYDMDIISNRILDMLAQRTNMDMYSRKSMKGTYQSSEQIF